MLLTELPTPFLTVDHARLRANITAMQTLASTAGVRLRPHTKTHKSAAIARWQLEAGAVGICCAKLAEAESLADEGITDIRLPYPLNPVNASRVRALLDRGVRLSFIVDDLEVARGWSQAMTASRHVVDVLVKVDVGFHRCGVDPESVSSLDTIKGVADLGGLSLRGLLSHAGQAYHAGSIQELGDIATKEIGILRNLAARAKEAGVEVHEVSVGSTPTARFITIQQGATEMRPGNYVFFDRTQVGLRAADTGSCALSIVSMVVSRPAPGRIVFDAGSKTLTSDGVRGFGTPTGHGAVFTDLESAQPDGSITIERLSEEHAVARLPASCRLKPGDRVRIVPNHACTATNLANELVLADGLTVMDRLQVTARGRNY